MTIQPAGAPIEFQVGDETFSLKMGFTAICSMEKAFNLPFSQVMVEKFGSNVRMDDVLTIFHACLLSGSAFAPTEDVSREEAAGIIDKLGIERVAKLILAAVAACPLLSPPKPEKRVRGAGPAKRPAKAAKTA